MGTGASCGGKDDVRKRKSSPFQQGEEKQQHHHHHQSPFHPPQYAEVHFNRMDGVWRERMLEAVDGDPVAVTRDFPRIPVYVATHTHHNYCEDDGEQQDANNNKRKKKKKKEYHNDMDRAQDTVDAKEGKRHYPDENPKEDDYNNGNNNNNNNDVELLATRNQRVRTAVGFLMELCGEDASGMYTAWSTHAARVDVADASALLLAVLLESGMMRAETLQSEKKTNTQIETTTTTETREVGNPPNYGTVDAVTRSSPHYKVESKALRLMQYMVQSVVFCSIQWITELLRFPWCKHIQDVAWTVHVFTEKKDIMDGGADYSNMNSNSNNDETRTTEFIVLQHKQTLRHYVEPRELRHKPRFEIDWSCSIVFNPQYILCGDTAKEVYDVRTEVFAARVERPQRRFCLISSDWRQRRHELAERLEEHFGVPLEEVSTLMQRQPDGRR